MKFLLDTNFLIIPAQFGVDIFEFLKEFGKPELFTLNLCLYELKKTPFEGLTKDIIKKREIRIEDTRDGSATDSEICRIAKEKKMVVCTQDKELISRLKTAKVPVITLRQNRYLVMI